MQKRSSRISASSSLAATAAAAAAGTSPPSTQSWSFVDDDDDVDHHHHHQLDLPTYNPLSSAAKREQSRLRFAHNAVHLIPLLLLLCALVLWFFSNPEL
ncbi:hypothetical protein TIFTF001_003061 [Ficus carica]|uniref:Transmembrane protein n=1 Tax=Ficus carica TaxID=3494 RepID=A0AA87ZBE5_FICCA|nr:hypothetical protein TIFTF001_003061 [Ficus carica]